MFERIKALIRQVMNKLLNKGTIQNELKVDIAVTDRMANNIDLWIKLYENRAPWLSKTVKSANLSASIASEIARLVTIEFESEIVNNDYLNEQYQTVIKNIRRYTEYACAKGGLVFKPYINGSNIEVDYVQADGFYPTAYNSRGEITGAVFVETKVEGEYRYTRLEYHNLTSEGYKITNTAFMSRTAQLISDIEDLGKQVPLSAVDDWAGLEPEVTITNVDKPLFCYFKMPGANTIEPSSPLGVSVFSRAIGLIREADKQYSRILWEYEGSELAIDADVDLFTKDRNGNSIMPEGKERLYRKLDMQDNNSKWNVFSPAIRDSNLFNGFNQLLRRIEFNCGLAYGTISDVQDVDKTATEIKASKQRSYSTVKDIQNSLQDTLEHLAYVMNVWAVIAGLSDNSDYEMSFNWDDSIIIDKDADLLSMQQDVASGLIRPELYIAKKYGVTEKEALKMMPDTASLVTDNPLDKGGNQDTNLPEGNS